MHSCTNLKDFIPREAAMASAVLGMVILSVRPSATRVRCGETKEHTADTLIPHKTVIWFSDISRGLWAMFPSTLNLRSK